MTARLKGQEHLQSSIKGAAVISSALERLPALPQLQTWVHRPQALAKCTISDIYEMRAVVYEGAGRYAGHDVFLLDQFPCKMVEMVGWVAGVDEKDKTQTVYLDDGDGKHVLPVSIRLSLTTPSKSDSASTSPTKPTNDKAQDIEDRPRTTTSTSAFKSAKERKVLRKAFMATAALQDLKGKRPALPPVKMYERHDIRVGDVVKIRGRIDEWMRGKEWIRQVAVEPAAGGSICVVDPDEQYDHLRKVHELHWTIYSQPFQIPSFPEVSTSAASMSTYSNPSIHDLSTHQSHSYSDSLSLTIEPSSEMSMTQSQLNLCDPSRLRSSQLTDRTFRQYLLDHMTQETIDHLTRMTAIEGKDGVRFALQAVFPEYRDLWPRSGDQQTPSRLAMGSSSRTRTPFSPSSLHNTIIDLSEIDDPETTPRSYKTLPLTRPQPNPQPGLEGFTISALLAVPHLSKLAHLVVEEQSRKEEKRRRRRIRDGIATPKDVACEGQSWKLTDGERLSRMERLVRWVIRGLSEEGVLVQAHSQRQAPPRRRLDHTSSPSQSRRKETSSRVDDAYIPLPEILLFPLLVPHIQAESLRRTETFLRRTDERYGHGILLPEITGRLRQCGEAGRWERVGEWCVEDALVWGERAGLLRKVGKGWVVSS